MINKTNRDLAKIYSDLVKGLYTPQEPLIGLIFMKNFTESCTCFKNNNNNNSNLVCYLPYGRLAWLKDYNEFEFLTNSKHIIWQD